MMHELLAPAGSYDICKSVLAAGADAVYLGGEKFGARAFAHNFSEEEILDALDLAHLHQKKIYLTVNTLLKNKEIKEQLYRFLLPFYQHGLDAVIVQDYGVFQFVKTYFEELPIHVSTQMSVANAAGVSFLKESGAARVVPARELSLAEIRRIFDATGMEIESFVHGALCYSYSGQCLFSSLLGGRSGNRGRCAQPCRLPYQVVDEQGALLKKKQAYPLSPKDLCAIDLLPQLCQAGVFSFKLEGRMKSLEYATGITQIYRKYLDLYEENPQSYRVEEEDIRRLLSLGNRNGFTKGYYDMRNGSQMMSLTSSAHTTQQSSEASVLPTLSKIPVSGRLSLHVDKPASLAIQSLHVDKPASLVHPSLHADAQTSQSIPSAHGEICVTHGDLVLPAKNRPLEEADVKKRISKTGDTPFFFEQLQVDMDGDAFLSVSQLNGLRREALEAFKQQQLLSYRRQAPAKETEHAEAKKNAASPYLHVFVSTRQQLEVVLEQPYVAMVSVSADDVSFAKEAAKSIRQAKKTAALCFPPVFRQNSEERTDWKALCAAFDVVWVLGYDSLGFCLYDLKLAPEKIGLDGSLYVFSDDAFRGFFEQHRFFSYTVSSELNQKELAHMPNAHGEFCLYGYRPVMVSAQCIYKNYEHCQSKRQLWIKDRYEQSFYVKKHCADCYNTIYNSKPLFFFHQAEAVRARSFGSYRICFLNETPKEVSRILTLYRQAFLEGTNVRPPKAEQSFTLGHFKRGVD